MSDPAITEPLYCPICEKETTLKNTDDTGTQFYKCIQGHFTPKALTQDAKKQLNAYKCEADQYGEKYVPPHLKSFVNEKGAFKPALVAQWLQAEYNFKIDRQTETFYYGDKETKTWKPKAEIYLQEILTNALREENTKAIYANVLHDLKGLCYTDIVFSKKIMFENGLLDVETLDFTKPTLEEMVYYSVPVKYDPETKNLDEWIAFLGQVVNSEDIPLLQEWFGYCLLPDYRFHKALWVHGEGRNGKGVYDRTIQGILGTNNVSAVPLEALSANSRFSLKDFYGKLYNTSSEPISNKVFMTEIFQKATGQDLIKAEIKGKNDLIEFRNCSKITIFGNKFPKINNPTKAFKDRMMFVKFPNYFDDKTRVINKETVWLNDPVQRSSILNWALEGLQRLLKQGFFTQTKTQRETEIDFNRVSSPADAFIMEQGIFDKSAVITRAANFEAYQNYCEGIGVVADSKVLTQAMQKQSPKVRDGWVNKPKKERVWFGFKVENSEQSSLEQMPQLEQQNILGKYFEDDNLKIRENKIGVPSVPSVPSEPFSQDSSLSDCSEVSEVYRQLTCVFCQKGIMDNDWMKDDFSWNKPAHRLCYDVKRSELAVHDKGEGF